MNEEMISKAKEAKSVEELLALAEENNIELSEEQAKAYFDRLHANGELSDDELDNVAGGGCGGGGGGGGSGKTVYHDTPACGHWVHRNCGGTMGNIKVSIEDDFLIYLYNGPGCLKCNDRTVMCHNCQYAASQGALYKCTFNG